MSMDEREKVFKNKINRLKKLTNSNNIYDDRKEVISKNTDERRKSFK